MRDPENSDPTQAQMILRRLQEFPNVWVPMPELAHVSGAFAVHSRISELREHGFDIEVKLEGNRPRHSFYRLIVPILPTNTTFEFDNAAEVATTAQAGGNTERSGSATP